MIIIKFRARMSLIWLNVRKINCFIYSKRHFSWFFFREFDEKHGIVRTRRAFFLPVRIYQFTQRPREIVLKTPFTVLFFVCHTHLIPYTILHMYTYFIFLYRYGQIFIYISTVLYAAWMWRNLSILSVSLERSNVSLGQRKSMQNNRPLA